MIRHDKVYCRYCKHYIPFWKIFLTSRGLNEVMECKLEEYWRGSFESPRGERQYRTRASKKNRNNDCSNYSPKARWQ